MLNIYIKNKIMGDIISQVVSDEPCNTLLTPEIYNLTYEELLALLWELNTLAKKCLDSNGHQLVFAVKKNTDSTALWKATIQIACAKIEKETRKVISYRLLSLSQFLKVFKTFKCQISAAEQSKSDTSYFDKLNFSQLLNNVDLGGYSELEGDECIICFERKQEITLPCTHSYCSHCIEEWNESHDTCPICREKLESTDEAWVISEMPNAEEISTEIKENFLELTEEQPTLCNTS